MPDYPRSITAINQVAPAPRRIRGMLGGRAIFDTLRALYVWEWPFYPQYYIPAADVEMSLFTPDVNATPTPQGNARRLTLASGAGEGRAAARLIVDSPIAELRDTVRFIWSTLDEWFEEDEEIFVHPRNPYTRVDALRSTRAVRIELEGIVLAESASPIMLFETGLPPRCYVDARNVRFEHLVPSTTRTECPYKGRTTGYWSVRIGTALHPDLAWMYSFPTRQVLPIMGLVAFLDEKVDVFIDGTAQPRPKTHFGG